MILHTELNWHCQIVKDDYYKFVLDFLKWLPIIEIYYQL